MIFSLSRGLKNGVQMLELDCHLTKDRQAVVHHDAALNRTTEQFGFIRDVDYSVCLDHSQTYPMYILLSIEITKYSFQSPTVF